MSPSMVPDMKLIASSPLGEFSWRWPDSVERFMHGWTAIAEVDGDEVRLRHGVGGRNVFGRFRVHSVTWVENDPTVEGVEADDFASSDSLLSLIKVTKRHLRPDDMIPPGYADFTIAVMAEEAKAKYSPRSLAVKIRQDDIDGWVRHALLRAAAWGRLRPKARDRSMLPATTVAGPASVAVPSGTPTEQRTAVVEALLAFGGSHPEAVEGEPIAFTPNRAANELIRDDPFAFLCAVIFDQGVPAEKAWLAPFLLRERLGYLDPQKIAANETAVREAIQQPPTLHRYVDKMPTWIVKAARRVMTRYDGDARRIWSDTPRADELQRRFDEFIGIGQKKAAMAVEILERDLGVPIENLEHSDVAYDVHVRRVFLRARLADRDDVDHIVGMARELYPKRPGALDYPTWLVGRGWCHPGLPNCAPCPLTAVCPKDIERAAHVTSG